MRSDFNLPPGCTARDISTNGAPIISKGRRRSGEPLTVKQARKLWKHYDKVFGDGSKCLLPENQPVKQK